MGVGIHFRLNNKYKEQRGGRQSVGEVVDRSNRKWHNKKKTKNTLRKCSTHTRQTKRWQTRRVLLLLLVPLSSSPLPFSSCFNLDYLRNYIISLVLVVCEMALCLYCSSLVNRTNSYYYLFSGEYMQWTRSLEVICLNWKLLAQSVRVGTAAISLIASNKYACQSDFRNGASRMTWQKTWN